MTEKNFQKINNPKPSIILKLAYSIVVLFGRMIY